MLKIGDFSKLSLVSIQTLRHYDDLGLLKPEVVDTFTGYRYYAFHQLQRLNRILALKDLGLSLEQVAQVLTEDLSAEQLRGMLKMKRAEIEQRVVDEQERLARVEARLRQIEQEHTMPNYDVIIKTVEPQLVASIRRSMPRYNETGPLFGELYAYLAQCNVTVLAGAVWHDEGYKEQDVDAEAVAYLKQPTPETEQVKVYTLPGASVASLVHNGAYNRFQQAYAAINAWIDANGYRIVGPTRELYHYCTFPVTQDNESYVTEIQFPVEKV